MVSLILRTLVFYFSRPAGCFPGKPYSKCRCRQLQTSQTIDLQAISSGFSGTWTQTSGPGTGTFANTGSPVSSVTIDTFGTYTFQWEEVNGICAVADEVQIIFNESPAVNALNETCNGTNTQYTVTFSVTGEQRPIRRLE